MNAGDVFRLKDDAIEGGHPWVVLCVPHGHPPVVAIGNFTAYHDNKDQSCVVEACDEPCLKKKSVFSYRDARIVTVAELTLQASNGEVVFSGTILPDTLNAIYEGAAVTKFMPLDPFEALDALGLIPVI